MLKAARYENEIWPLAFCLAAMAGSAAAWCGEPVLERVALKDVGNAADRQFMEVINVGELEEAEENLDPAPPRIVHFVINAINREGADRVLLEGTIQAKLDLVDYVCHLTKTQKQKLLLAGRGDIKHLIDEARELQSVAHLIVNNGEQGQEPRERLRQFNQRRVADFAGDLLLFDKLLINVLTPEQDVKYEPLREVYRLNGSAFLRRQGAGKELVSFLEVNLFRTALTDEGLLNISSLPNLADMNLSLTHITDTGLSHLRKLRGLKKLNLEGCDGISDVGMAHLKPLVNLTFLRLHATPVGDAGVAQLKELKNLSFLMLGQTHITDAGMVHLGRLVSLEILQLANTNIGNAGLIPLQELRNLTDLNLIGTHITDAGLKHLRPITRLRSLTLDGIQITDLGISELERLTSLRELTIGGTALTVKGIADLKQTFPNFRVIK